MPLLGERKRALGCGDCRIVLAGFAKLFDAALEQSLSPSRIDARRFFLRLRLAGSRLRELQQVIRRTEPAIFGLRASRNGADQRAAEQDKSKRSGQLAPKHVCPPMVAYQTSL